MFWEQNFLFRRFHFAKRKHKLSKYEYKLGNIKMMRWIKIFERKNEMLKIKIKSKLF